MADPTNRNDPTFANDPSYVWSGGRWQYRGNPNAPAPGQPGNEVTRVRATSEGTPGLSSDLDRQRDAAINAILRNIADAQMYRPHADAFSPDERARWLQEYLRGQIGAGNRFNARFATGMADQTRAAQMQLVQQLMDQASGVGPSIAEGQLQRAGEQNQRAAASAMTQARGMGAGAAQRQVLGQQAAIGQDIAQQAGLQRLQEQMMARAALGQQLGGMRQQDIGQAQIGAGFNLQAQMADQARLQQLLAHFGGMTEADRAARIGLEQMRGGQQASWQATNMSGFGPANQAMNQGWQNAMQLLGMFTGAGATIAGAALGK